MLAQQPQPPREPARPVVLPLTPPRPPAKPLAPPRPAAGADGAASEDGGAFNLFDPAFLGRVGGYRQEPLATAPTGLASWDAVCGGAGGNSGLAQGWFVTLGGNPGFGKTLMALNMAAAFVKTGLDVCFVTLEMSPLELANRIYRIACNVDLEMLGHGAAFDVTKFDLAKNQIESWAQDKGRVYVNKRPISSIEGVMSFVRWCHDEYGTKVVVVDYLQLASAGDEEEIYRQTTKVANALRMFAHSKRALVVGLSQFNRQTSSNYMQSPQPQGLHGGMILEASSDQVALIDHSLYKKDEQAPHLARTWLILGKNRYGARVNVPVEWNFKRMTVREAMADELDLWPTRDRKSRS